MRDAMFIVLGILSAFVIIGVMAASVEARRSEERKRCERAAPGNVYVVQRYGPNLCVRGEVVR